MKRSYLSVIYAFYTGIMPIVSSGMLIAWLATNQNQIEKGNFKQMIFCGLLSILLAGLSIVPTSVLALIFGYLFGLKSLCILIPAYLLATILGYFLGKTIDGNSILQLIDQYPKAKQFLGRLKSEQSKIVALSRLSPVFPFGISNVIFTYMTVPLSTLLWAGLLGMLPRTIGLVWVGSNAQNLLTAWQNDGNMNQFFLFIGLVATAIILFILVKIWHKK